MSRAEMNVEARRDLTVLEAIERDQRITQRSLATKLGIALGLTNIYLRRLIRKGYVKCVNVQSNRLLYLLTPQGLTEKSRLTYEFMDYSLHLYKEVRIHLRNILQPFAGDPTIKIALYGTGEAAELAYLSLKEVGIEPAAVFAQQRGGHFLGIPVWALDDHRQVAFELLIVATLDSPDPLVASLAALGIPRERLLTLIPPTSAAPRPEPLGVDG